jgi:type IV pilus assembly protein PilA
MKHVNNKGFSLIELMIVVAIIGILATVAIPNFQKFQGKAKQSEAKSQLGGLYMSQKAFSAEYSFYPGQFGVMGFVPQGQLNYRILSFDNTGAVVGGVIARTNLPGTMDVPACISTAAGACTPAAFGGTLPVWTETPTAAASSTAATGSDPAFKATAGAAFTGIAVQDEWSIDENNLLVNTKYGI